MTVKRPSFQFYPGDWLNDAGLRLVSVGARGLWIDMLCMMHQGTPYGHLKVAGKVILAPNLARTLGATLAEVEGWLAELKDVGAYSIAEDGCIYSRRMIRDEELRAKRAAGGSCGGNPTLKPKPADPPEEEQKVNHTSNLSANLDANLEPTPSSSSSSSSSSKENHKDTNLPMGIRHLGEMPLLPWCNDSEVRRLLTIWGTLTPMFEAQVSLQLDRLRSEGWDKNKLLRALQAACETGSKSLYDPAERKQFARARKDYR